MNNKPISFWQFLKKNSIEIPILQRDYAQGRKGKEYLRKKFLLNIKKAIENSSNASLTLDFVYGSKQKEKFSPLDGQQRLTTLWLLHWYLALISGNLQKNTSDILKRFSYETRISSRDFCECLCNYDNFGNFDYKKEKSIASFIMNQTWFYSSWKQDPTILSMLRMLGGLNETEKEFSIEGIFYNKDQAVIKNYWEKLLDNNPPIVFNQLLLEVVGLSDDLYIKMNSRGKQLTPYENFKADLIDYLREESEKNEGWSVFLDPSKGIPIKLDTEWSDLFWEKTSNDNRIDEIMFAFINRFFWNELFTFKNSNGEYILKIEQDSLEKNNSFRLLDSDPYDQYTSLQSYKFFDGRIPQKIFSRFQSILDRLNQYLKKWKALPECSWDKDFCFIPKYINNSDSTQDSFQISQITQIYRIVFFSLCKYFSSEDSNNDEEVSLKKWMRVIWNLVSGKTEDGNNLIRSIQAVKTAIDKIDCLDSHNVYESLKKCSRESNEDSYFSLRWNEEIEKAKQILSGEFRPDGKKWEDVIIEAENYGFFNGSIRFLFQNEAGEVDWSNFDKKFANTKKFFKKKVDSDKDESGNYVMQNQYKKGNLLKKLISWLSTDDFWEILWYKHKTFNNKPETWLYYLLNKDNYKAVHHVLLDESNPNPVSSLQKSNEANNALYWLINTPLLDFVNCKIPNSWIRYYHEHLAIYPSGTGVFLDAHERDALLSELHKNKKINIEGNHLIEGTTLLFGSDINFSYMYNCNTYYFQWYRNDEVYFMDDDYSSYKLKKESDDESYYFFKTSDFDFDQDSFIRMLNSLIEDVTHHQKKK